MPEKLLEVKNLRTSFFIGDNVFPAVDDVSFYIDNGETLGLVGESGCGKSITCLSLLRLVPDPPGKIISGEILFRGRDLLQMNDKELRGIRGNNIAMVFQEPMTSLNPVMTIGRQLQEVFILHQGAGKKEAREKAVEVLRLVGIALPEKRIKEYPHQLSGGMRQRVMIAMALAGRPALLLADEPTTALDVTIQAQILELIKELKASLGMAMLIITHFLGVIAETADRVAVMYAGQIVEEANVHDLFAGPFHPYTRGLMLAMPVISGRKGQLHVIPGSVPRLSEYPQGCRFYPRCEHGRDICRQQAPGLRPIGSGHAVRCWLGTDEYNERMPVNE